MSRRFLLGDQVLEEEDDAQEDISGAGNGMNCGNKEIEEVRQPVLPLILWLPFIHAVLA